MLHKCCEDRWDQSLKPSGNFRLSGKTDASKCQQINNDHKKVLRRAGEVPQFVDQPGWRHYRSGDLGWTLGHG